MEMMSKRLDAQLHAIVPSPILRIGLPLLLALLFMLLLLNISANTGALGVCLVSFVLFSLPGHYIVYPLLYAEGKMLEGFIWGIISGTGMSALAVSVIVYLIGWNLVLIALVIAVLPGALLWQRAVKGRPAQGRPHTADLAVTGTLLLAVLILCVVFFYFPFRNLGAHIEDRQVFAWLFGHDFINRQVHAVSLSRGLPLDSYHFAGEHLSYYWLAYVYPALLYRLFPAALSVQQALQIASVLYSLTTASALCLFLAHFAKRKRVLVLLLLLSFVCYSYMDLYLLGRWSLTAFMPASFGQIATGFDSFAGFSHSLYRFFLVEPQGTFAIGVMLLVILLENSGRKDTVNRVLLGLFLGLLFGVEATMGIMLAAWFLAVAAHAVLTRPGVRIQVLREYALSLIAAGAVYACLFAIEMYSFSTGRGVLTVKPNMTPLLLGFLYFPIEYGPMLFFGAAGLIKVFTQKERHDHWIHQFVILLAVNLFFILFIVNPTESQFGLLKATRIVPICLLMLTLYCWQDGLPAGRGKGTILLLLVLAAPGYFTDLYIATDVRNPASTFIKDADYAACAWIRKSLPVDAVVQAEPNHPGADSRYQPRYVYSLIPVFAERPTAIGEWKVSSQEHGKADQVSERFHGVKRMFALEDAETSLALLQKYNIQYVYVGPLERTLYPRGVSKFRNNPALFENVYSRSEVDIYRVASNPRSAP